MISVNHKYLFHFILFFAIAIAQLYFPVIYIKEISSQADIVLLYITVISILYGRFAGIDAIGLAFQIKDDIIEAEGSTEIIGKSSTSDIRQGKSTFPILFGLDESKKRILEL